MTGIVGQVTSVKVIALVCQVMHAWQTLFQRGTDTILISTKQHLHNICIHYIEHVVSASLSSCPEVIFCPEQALYFVNLIFWFEVSFRMTQLTSCIPKPNTLRLEPKVLVTLMSRLCIVYSRRHSINSTLVSHIAPYKFGCLNVFPKYCTIL